MKKWLFLLFFTAFWIVLAGCTSTSGTDPVGVSAETGKALFRQTVLGGTAGCATCHSLQPGTILVGPSLAGIGTTAGARVEDLSAEEYISQSILEPDAYLVQGFPAGVMPGVYQDTLSQDEVNSLVTYLLSLE